MYIDTMIYFVIFILIILEKKV